MLTRRDWYIGVATVSVALVLHGAIPRFEYRRHSGTSYLGTTYMKVDRWTGHAEIVNVARAHRGDDWNWTTVAVSLGLVALIGILTARVVSRRRQQRTASTE